MSDYIADSADALMKASACAADQETEVADVYVRIAAGYRDLVYADGVSLPKPVAVQPSKGAVQARAEKVRVQKEVATAAR